ncbi:MAG: hypothetical protein ABIY55_24555 [Kofleriaceae bacterium]
MANDSSGGDQAQVLELALGASGTALGLTITFTGGTPVYYGESKPPAGSVTLTLEHEGQRDTVAWLQSDWGDAHEAFGYSYRVLNAAELKPRSVRVEVRKATK